MTDQGKQERRLAKPTVVQSTKVGAALGTAYAVAATGFVLVTGGVPDAWGEATLWSLVLVEIAGGTIGGLLFGLLAPLARYLVGALIVTPIGLAPLITGVAVLVEGPSHRTVLAGLISSFLIGVIVGQELWRHDSRHW